MSQVPTSSPSLTGTGWNVRSRAPRELFDALPDIPPIVVQVLHNRGYDMAAKVRVFLDGLLLPHDPFLLDGMDVAVRRITRALKTGEQICVYGDYDVDGVTSTALLVEALSMLGGHVFPYIPERVSEGYGLNVGAMDTIYGAGARLIVTADCGSKGEAAIARAAEHGIDVVVTDHHRVVGPASNALVVLNPNVPGNNYPFPGLAGVGVAYKLVQALAVGHPERLPHPEKFLDLVALGTIGDVAPLRDENRTFVVEGLEGLRKTHRVGVRELAEVAGRPVGQADAQTVAFTYAPRINAAGRIASAELALELLQARHPIRAQELARQLHELNRERRLLTEGVVADAAQSIDHKSGLVFAVGPNYPPGVTGLAAAQLMRATGFPAFVATEMNGMVRGSARVPDGLDLTEILGRHQQILDNWGGHARAAGFSLNLDRAEELRKALAQDFLSPTIRVRLGRRLDADCRVYPRTISWETYRNLDSIGPFGAGHEQPCLVVENVAVEEIWVVGKHHLAMRFVELDSQVEAIWFDQGGQQDNLHAGLRVDVAFCLGTNTFGGTTRLQILVEDLRLAIRE